jgi:hypothetical protein
MWNSPRNRQRQSQRMEVSDLNLRPGIYHSNSKIRSAELIDGVKILASKIADDNDADQFLDLALRMHRLLDEFLRGQLKPRVN